MPSLTDSSAQRIIDESIANHKDQISELKERISELEERISDHKAAILALNARRNTHSAISKLPTELIVKIFLHRKCDAIAQSEARWSMDWLDISSVCRRWCAIISGTPQLWCFLVLSRTQLTLDILKRSKSMSLHVLCDDSIHQPAVEVIKSIMSYIERIQELDVSGSTVQQAKFLAEFFHRQKIILPRLTRLVLRSSFAPFLLIILPCTPAVQDIQVSTRLPGSTIATEVPRISLPKLASLRMTATRPCASRVFDYIDYPDSTIVEFVSPVSGHSPDFPSLQHLCSRFAAGSRATSQDQMSIDVDAEIFEVQLRPSDVEWPSHFKLSLALPAINPGLLLTMYMQLCSTFPLSTIHTLALRGFKHHPIKEWLTVFSLCREVTTLRLTMFEDKEITDLLRIGSMQRPLFEKLETIVMSDCSSYFSGGECTDKMCDAIRSILNERKTYGMAIRKLRIEKSNVSRRIIEEFEGLVRVDWDGMEW